MPSVPLITPDDGHRRCPKRVEFRDKIKFWILDAVCWLFIRRLFIITLVKIKNKFSDFSSMLTGTQNWEFSLFGALHSKTKIVDSLAADFLQAEFLYRLPLALFLLTLRRAFMEQMFVAVQGFAE